MSEETKSEILSWEEWVEQLTLLSTDEQFSELLRKAKELKDKNMILQEDINDKKEKIRLMCVDMDTSNMILKELKCKAANLKKMVEYQAKDIILIKKKLKIARRLNYFMCILYIVLSVFLFYREIT